MDSTTQGKTEFNDDNKLETTAEVNVIFDYSMTFIKDNGVMGKLDFNGPKMVFTGDAEESAKIFIDWLAKSFAERLAKEREACAKVVDHILKEGGGTYGDAIRKL